MLFVFLKWNIRDLFPHLLQPLPGALMQEPGQQSIVYNQNSTQFRIAVYTTVHNKGQ